MNTKRKTTKKERMFTKYTKKDYLTESQIKKMMKQDFRLTYNKHVMTSFMSIWSTTVNDKKVITKSTFVGKLFAKPDGFFRDICI